ncbi:hypothetical protein A9Q84_00455 [Halobacteriovorax marinus]|uniref:Alpha/beta hydrolase n=1 Tax=Halobacteriovorax marinus TaxID=97084 RepID=A0A1Y5FBM3_9BACT|nr:hypothetical protein A9Q84_00455 [Halobacteriovorax marinus]
MDAQIAKYYLENYLTNQVTNPKLHQEIQIIDKEFKNLPLGRESLKLLSEKTSVDFATLYFGNKLLNKKENDSVQEQFLSNLKNIEEVKLPSNKDDFLIIMVPGLDYIDVGHLTGADLKAPIAILRDKGLNVEFVPIHPMGSVSANAADIVNVIKKNQDKKIIVAGPSSAGAAIHLALGKLLDKKELKSVRAWLNLGGILNGSPLVDWIDSGMTVPIYAIVRWFKDWEKETFESMKTKASQVRFKTLDVPKHIFILNYLGLSLSGDISDFGMDKYKILRELGPNDALTLLPDAIAPNSSTVLAPKSDHFFGEDPLIGKKALALLYTIFDNIH